MRILELAEGVIRRGNAIKTLVARRATEGSQWAREGHRSAEDWLAAKGGTGFADAERLLQISARLEELPNTAEALRAGRLSEDQASAQAPLCRRARPDALGRGRGGPP